MMWPDDGIVGSITPVLDDISAFGQQNRLADYGRLTKTLKRKDV
jgi:hypothetical protein